MAAGFLAAGFLAAALGAAFFTVFLAVAMMCLLFGLVLGLTPDEGLGKGCRRTPRILRCVSGSIHVRMRFASIRCTRRAFFARKV